MSPGDRTAVLLDPHPLWLDAVELVLTRNGVAVVAQTTDPDRALALVEEFHPSVLVAEAAGEGLACIRKACAKFPGTEGDRPVVSGRRGADRGCVRGRRARIRAEDRASRRCHASPSARRSTTRCSCRARRVAAAPANTPRRRLRSKRHGGLTHEARARDPAAGRRRTLEQPARPNPLGDGADGEVPSLQHLPEAGCGQPDRSKPLGAGARSPEPRASGRGWQQRQLMRDEGDGGVEGEHHRGDLGDHLGQLDR